MSSMVHRSSLTMTRESNRKLRERITALEQEVETHKARAKAREKERDEAVEQERDSHLTCQWLAGKLRKVKAERDAADERAERAEIHRCEYHTRLIAAEQRAEEAERENDALRDDAKTNYEIARYEEARADRLAEALRVLARGTNDTLVAEFVRVALSTTPPEPEQTS